MRGSSEKWSDAWYGAEVLIYSSRNSVKPTKTTPDMFPPILATKLATENLTKRLPPPYVLSVKFLAR